MNEEMLDRLIEKLEDISVVNEAIKCCCNEYISEAVIDNDIRIKELLRELIMFRFDASIER